MKRHLTLLAAVAMTILCVSCNKDDTQSDPYITITTPTGENPNSITIEATAYSQDFTISSNASWRIEKQPSTADWLTVSPLEGNGDATIKVSAPANEQTSRLQAMLTFYSGNTKLHSLTIVQNPAASYLNVEPIKPDSIPAEGGDITLNVSTNAGSWDAEITGDNSAWLTEKERTETTITFTADVNATPDQLSANVKFTAPSDDPDFEKVITITQNGLIADLLDIQFLEDGTATDVSPMNKNVETLEGPYFSTAYLESYKKYVGRFAPTELATSLSDSYLKIDYAGDEAYKSALADGHTMEMLIMLNSDLKIGSEIKMFSSMQGGGTGFLLKKETNEFTFLPYVGGGWKWCTSGIVPEKGVYYHVVGVWNKDAGKAYIYINGELKGEIEASGDLSFPNTEACHWFCVGGDPGSATNAECCWIGDIGIARIYDKVLTDAQVAALYDRINE